MEKKNWTANDEDAIKNISKLIDTLIPAGCQPCGEAAHTHCVIQQPSGIQGCCASNPVVFNPTITYEDNINAADCTVPDNIVLSSATENENNIVGVLKVHHAGKTCAAVKATTPPTPNSACMAGTPDYVEKMQHCGKEVDGLFCRCEKIGGLDIWFCTTPGDTWGTPGLAPCTVPPQASFPSECTSLGANAGFNGLVLPGSPHQDIHGDACAVLCADNVRCGYWLDHISEGCILKASIAKSAVKKSQYLEHGTCSHAVRATCQGTCQPTLNRRRLQNDCGDTSHILHSHPLPHPPTAVTSPPSFHTRATRTHSYCY